MNKVATNFIVIVMAAFLLLACGPNMPAQSSDQTLPSQQPGSVAVEASTAVPGVVSQPLSEMTPVTPAAFENGAGEQKIITRDAHGKTIILAVGETVLFSIGDGYTWEIVVSDESVFSRLKNITVVQGSQGVYEAHKIGTATISAVGDPLCRMSKPPCGMPSIQMEFTIEVK